MDKPPEIKIIYKVIGDPLPFEKISQLAGLKPSRICHKGELISRSPGIQRWKWDFWRLETVYQSTWCVDQALRWFLADNRLPTDPLTRFCNENGYEQIISIVVYMAGCTPAITLEPDLMAHLSHHKITIDFDLYLLPPDESEADTDENSSL